MIVFDVFMKLHKYNTENSWNFVVTDKRLHQIFSSSEEEKMHFLMQAFFEINQT